MTGNLSLNGCLGATQSPQPFTRERVLVGGGYECVLTHMNEVPVCQRELCVVHTWHFPQSAHFNDFIDMNVFLLTDHILVSI